MICYPTKRKRRVSGRLVESRDWFGVLRMDWDVKARVWSLGTSDKREAERLLHAERVKQEKIRHGLLPSSEQADAANRPLNEVLDAFLAELRATGRAETTLKKYRNMRVLFTRCRWKKVADVTARSFCEWRRRCELSAKSVNDLLKNTRGFFAWLRRSRMATEDPLEFVPPVKSSPKQFRRAETPERLQRLLAVASPQRAAVYLVAVQTGLRRKELQALTLGDFELSSPKPFVRVPASISKNRKEATLWLRPEVVDAVRGLVPANAGAGHKVFAGHVPRLPRFKKDLELAGIPFEDTQGRRFDLHALRVTFGTNLSIAGVTPRVAMELMRHSDIKLTMRIYTDPSQLPTAAAVESLPAFSLPARSAAGESGSRDAVRIDGRDGGLNCQAPSMGTLQAATTPCGSAEPRKVDMQGGKTNADFGTQIGTQTGAASGQSASQGGAAVRAG